MARKKKSKLIPAVAYLRKSTKGKRRDGGQKQEKSLEQQQREIIKLAEGKYQILKWFEDEGISGNKRGPKRPNYTAMLDEVKYLGAEAILVDHLNRFSRGERRHVEEDLYALHDDAGVRHLVTASGKHWDLGQREKDLGVMLDLTIAIWGNHQFLVDHSRKVLIAMRNNAEKGIWNGGPIPLGYAAVMKGKKIVGLKKGTKRDVERLRWVFREFANGKSMNVIAADLNRMKVRSPRGSQWRPASVKKLLKNKTYIGYYVWNETSTGEHHRVDSEGEVVERDGANGHKIYEHPDTYPALIDRRLWNRVQKRLATIGGERRGRKASYPLSGILVCGHCGSGMTGCKPNGKVVYRCPGMKEKGPDFCAAPYQVREDQILPFIMERLGAEIDSIRELLTAPPNDLRSPKTAERQKQLAEERDKLDKDIATVTKNIARCDDDDLWKALMDERAQMKRRLDEMADELIEGQQRMKGYSDPELKALVEWWADFDANCVSVPLSQVPDLATTWYRDPECDSHWDPDAVTYRYLLDGRVANQKLKELGTKVELWWHTVQKAQRPRHTLVKGRFRLGQQNGTVPLVSFNNIGSPQ